MTQSRRYLVKKIDKLTSKTVETPRFLVCIEEKRGSRIKYYGDCGRDGLEQDAFIRWCEKQEESVQVIILSMDVRSVQTTLGSKQTLYVIANDYLRLDVAERFKHFIDEMDASFRDHTALQQQIELRKNAIEQTQVETLNGK